VWDWSDVALSTSTLKDHERSSRAESKHAWAGCSWDEAVVLLREGWQEGVDMARDFADKLRHELEEEYDLVKSPAFQNSMSGIFVNVGQYVAGRPDAMMDVRRVSKTRKVIKILINNIASFRVQPEVIVRRGAAVVALVDLLENMNVRCEVDVLFATYNSLERRTNPQAATNIQYKVRVKDADGILLIDNLMFMIAHPASLRRIAFSVMELEDKRDKQAMGVYLFGNYGLPDLDVPIPEDVNVYVPGLVATASAFDNDKKTGAWIMGILEEQGVFFDEDETSPTPKG